MSGIVVGAWYKAANKIVNNTYPHGAYNLLRVGCWRQMINKEVKYNVS